MLWPTLLCLMLLAIQSKSFLSGILSRSSRRPMQAMASPVSIITPISDDRPHKHLILANGINVVLVSDKTSKSSSCTLGIKIGAAADVLPGLAHITEHAVFLGSAKYPQENAYKSFLNKNGGGSNGGTGMEHTTYKFYVNADAFQAALDIFCQFFICPSFAAEAISREIHAVDAEDSKNRMLDARRQLQVLKHLMNQPFGRFQDTSGPTGQSAATDYAKFSTGNVQTLAFGDVPEYGTRLSEAIRTFHSKHYRPDRMAVALVGPQPLDELEALAGMFASIPEQTAVVEEKKHGSGDIFRLGQGQIVTMHALGESVRELSLIFTLPFHTSTTDTKWYNANPCTLISYCLNHKGPGTLFAFLQDKGLITGLTARKRMEFEPFQLLQVSLAMTPQGLANTSQLMGSVFEFISLLKASSDDALRGIWQDIVALHQIDFAFQAKQSAYEYAPYLVDNLMDYPPEEAVSAGSLLHEELDMVSVREMLDKLTPANTLSMLRTHRKQSDVDLAVDNVDHCKYVMGQFEAHLLSKGMDVLEMKGNMNGEYYQAFHAFLQEQEVLTPSNVLVEPYYGVSCTVHPAPPSEPVAHAFRLPEKNVFISNNLLQTYQPTSSLETRSLKPSHRAGGEVDLWTSQDAMFNIPKSILYLHLPVKGIDQVHPVMLSMISSMFAQVSARIYYSAGIAGIHYDISFTNRGVILSVDGYSTKLPLLLQQLADQLTNRFFWEDSILEEMLFDNCKDRLIRALQSWNKDRPDQQADTILNFIIQFDGRLPSDSLAIVTALTLDEFKGVVRGLFLSEPADGHRKVTLFLHGDRQADLATQAEQCLQIVTPLQAVCSGHPIDNRLKLARQLHGNAIVALPAFNEDEANSAMVMYFQASRLTAAVAARVMLLRRLLSEPAFSYLRTQQQLGYVVSLGFAHFGRGRNSIRGMSLRILSKKHSPLVLHKEALLFLSNYQQQLQALDDAALKQMTDSLVANLLDPVNNMQEEASGFWQEVMHDLPYYDLMVDGIAEELRKLTAEDVRQAADQWIYSQRKTVSVMIFGKNHLSDLAAMKEQPLSEGQEVCWDLEDVRKFRDSLPLYGPYDQEV